MTQREQVDHFHQLAKEALRESRRYRAMGSRALYFASRARVYAYMHAAKVVSGYWTRKLQREMRRAA